MSNAVAAIYGLLLKERGGEARESIRIGINLVYLNKEGRAQMIRVEQITS